MSIIITTISIAFAAKSNRQRIETEKKLKEITWEDMQNAANFIAKKLIKNYCPNVIYIPNIKSGIMLQFVKNYFSEYIPVIVGQAISKDISCANPADKIKDITEYWYVDTRNWYTYIPKALYKYKEGKILILDNLSLTGNFLQLLTDELIDKGIPKENIACACVATTDAAVTDKTAPEFYYKILMPSKDIRMPWG